jgi:hypothetical protein
MTGDSRDNSSRASGTVTRPAGPAASRPLILAEVEGLLHDWEPFLDEVEPAAVFAVSGRVDYGGK